MKISVAAILITGFLVAGGILFFVKTSNKELKNDPEVTKMIYTVDKFEALREQVMNVDQDTLLILDVDYTLLQPSHPAFQRGNFGLSPEFIKNFMKSLPEAMMSEFTTSIATSGDGQLLETDIPSILNAFEQKGAQILVISGILAGDWFDIPNIIDWRIQNLSNANIKTSSFGFADSYQFKNLPSYNGKYPEIKEGVILTNGELVKKHQVLDAFLKKTNRQPRKIIFVDDSRPIVDAMAVYVNQQKITFIGYEYRGAKFAKTDPIAKNSLEQAWINLKDSLENKKLIYE